MVGSLSLIQKEGRARNYTAHLIEVDDSDDAHVLPLPFPPVFPSLSSPGPPSLTTACLYFPNKMIPCTTAPAVACLSALSSVRRSTDSLRLSGKQKTSSNENDFNSVLG